jgi:hypothetical protein
MTLELEFKIPIQVFEIAMERVKGIEPSYSAWKTIAMPDSAGHTATRNPTFYCLS